MVTKVESELYAKLGVSSAKEGVERAASALDPGLHGNTFCRILPDIFSQDPQKCVLSHSDGAGTKAITAYLVYRATGDATEFRKIAHDALIMNLDDMLCVGAVNNFIFTSIINRNAARIGSDAVSAIIDGTLESIKTLSRLGIEIAFCGGETADIGDVVRTVLVDGSMTTQMHRSSVVRNELKPGHVIIGLSSAGDPATYEYEENSGIGANGLTLARHALLSASKLGAPQEVADDARTSERRYFGDYGLNDVLPGSSLTVAKALLSPTRTYAPVIKELLQTDRDAVSGMYHLTGGGQFKSLKAARGVRLIKQLPEDIPPIFKAIQNSTKLSWLEMARVFNLGWRMEVFCRPDFAPVLISIAGKYGISAAEIGVVEIGNPEHRFLELTVRNETETVQA